MDTEVDVPNPSLTLIPGMYAEVNLTLEHRNDAPVGSDRGSRTERTKHGMVYVVDPKNKSRYVTSAGHGDRESRRDSIGFAGRRDGRDRQSQPVDRRDSK